ncbi:hypothetical protein KR032_002013 [Drosophila birchii]|nr:hypothetical protein KR032_002013 [Drosophila birchii]
MWPETLEMSRDECRGMLRRLELESYSHVVSVFRAQGALSEPKAKLLEEMRQLFHITPERHRAEVRRAANDEQLSTIAENVCGPNTWQEWSREGRRPYPLLPRISPQTALSIVANDLAQKAFEENAKLATPAETGVHFGQALIEQASFMSVKQGWMGGRSQDPAAVIMEEPFKVPDVPNEVKKMTQKRKENESGVDGGKPNKKRHMQQHQQTLQIPHHQQQQQQQHQHQHLAHTANAEDGEPVPAEKRLSPRTAQQRFFYQQQVKHKQRLASKRNLASGLGSPSPSGSPVGGRNAAASSSSGGEATPAKRIAAPAKSGRRAQKQLQLQQQQKLQQHLQQQQQQQQAQLQQKVLLQSSEPTVPNHMVVQPHVEYVLDEALKTLAATSTPSTPTPTPTPTSTPTPPYSFFNDPRPLVTLKPLKPLKPFVYGPQSGSAAAAAEIGSPTTPGARGFANSPIVFKDKVQASPVHVQVQSQSQTTPVKKYIVEEKQADTTTNTTIPISTANLPLTPQIISVQQIPAPPMGAKLRPTAVPSSPTSNSSATLLPPGTKLTPKKFNLLDGGGEAKPKTLPSSAVRLLPYTDSIGGPSSPLKDSRVTPLSSASTVNIIKNIPASSLNNTLITPLPVSGGATMPGNLFRAKVTPPQLKAAGGVAVIGASSSSSSSGAAAGVTSASSPQILGNIKLTTSSGGAAATIKQVPSSALRNIKICSPNGKVFLQPGKLPAGSIIHKLNNASGSPAGTAAGSGVSTAVSPSNLQAREQRISIQKMQILPQATTGSGISGNSSSSPATSKQPGTKPTTVTFSTTSGGKNNLVFLPASAASGMRALTLATKPKPNVLVIGATSATSATISATSPSNPASGGAKPKPNQLITEDTPIDIINMPIIVADNGTGTELKQGSGVMKTSPLVVFNATDWEMELDQAATKTTPVTTPSKQEGVLNDDDVIVEEDEELEGDVVVEEQQVEESTNLELNNRIIELHPEDDSAIEYVDMDLEQPIEIESTSNISPETTATTTTSLKAAIVAASPQQKQKPLEQPLAAATL